MDSGSLKYISEPPHEELLPAPKRRFPFNLSRNNRILALGAVLVVVALAYTQLVEAPSGDAAQSIADSVITIPKGEGLSAVASDLTAAHAIRSEFALKALVVLFGGSRGVQAGDYYFTGPQNAVRIAWRITHSYYELVNVRVTIPEGFSSKDIGDLLAKEPRLPHFDQAEFSRLAAPYEGYLFPDTYLFLPNITAQGVVDAMLANYRNRIQSVQADIAAFGRPITDVIKMASIVEEEARTTETRETIAGILWKRLDKGMPLQVDAAFAFVNGKKDSRYLSTADLAIDSPYNTYIHKGLPPTPISNPGLDSIRATVHPIVTKYYFYLSDAQGNMHYAVTLDEHNANKAQFLNY